MKMILNCISWNLIDDRRRIELVIYAYSIISMTANAVTFMATNSGLPSLNRTTYHLMKDSINETA